MNRDLDEMWENMDGDDVCRILVQEAIDTLMAARPYNWQEKIDESLGHLFSIYDTDHPIDGVIK